MSNSKDEWVKHIHFSSSFETVKCGEYEDGLILCWSLSEEDYHVIETAAKLINFKENETLTTLGLFSPYVIVPPGFTWSFQIVYKYAKKELILDFFTKFRIFVLLFSTDERHRKFSEYAVIMQIESTTPNSNSTNKKSPGVITVNTMGMRRCQLVALSYDMVSHRNVQSQQVTVNVLQEPLISYFPNSAMQWSSKSYRHLCQKRLECLTKKCNYRRYDLAQYPLGGWIYNRNEAIYLVNQITNLLSPFYNNLPTDSMLLSFWFVRYFPQTRTEQVEIIKLNSLFQRLKTVLNRLKMEVLICCRKCKTEIAQDKDVSIRCNTFGIVDVSINVTRTMIRILKANNLKHNNKHSNRYPIEGITGCAYDSHGIQCISCKARLGFRFVSNATGFDFFDLNKKCIDILFR